jgi:hypothetical protein
MIHLSPSVPAIRTRVNIEIRPCFLRLLLDSVLPSVLPKILPDPITVPLPPRSLSDRCSYPMALLIFRSLPAMTLRVLMVPSPSRLPVTNRAIAPTGPPAFWIRMPLGTRLYDFTSSAIQASPSSARSRSKVPKSIHALPLDPQLRDQLFFIRTRALDTLIPFRMYA